MRGQRRLSAALSAITAAIVGVILNLALWFALHGLFAELSELRILGARILVPEWPTVDPAALLLSAGSFIALLWFRAGMIKTMAASAALGLLYRLTSG